MAYINKEYYVGSYNGEDISDTDFERLSEAASVIINLVTFGRAEKVINENSDEPKISAVKTASAIQTEYMYAQGGVLSFTGQGENLKTSENIGNYSYSRKADMMPAVGGIPISPLAMAVLDSENLRCAVI